MINYIWLLLIGLGLISALITGNGEVINETILNSGSEALNLVLDTMPLLIIWTGILKIAENSGLLIKLSKWIKPVLKPLFPSIKNNDKALGYITSNIAANALGLGSAATPFGLKAMQELDEINHHQKKASDAMITFLVLNTSGVTIIPTTVIALRVMYNSSNPTEIIITSLITTICSTVAGLTIDYIIRRINAKNN